MVFGSAVMIAPLLLVALASSRWLGVCAVILLVMGAAESGFATMQSTLVLLAAPERLRGAAMGILSACIGTQPLGTLAIGLLAASLGSPRAFTINALVSLAVIVPLAIPLDPPPPLNRIPHSGAKTLEVNPRADNDRSVLA